MNKLFCIFITISLGFGVFATDTNRAWFCVNMDEAASGKYYSGYGDTEENAVSNYFQDCNSARGLCDNYPYCDELDKANPKTWYCETKNISTAIHYTAIGRSKAEAMFFANKECARNSALEIVRDCKYIFNSICKKL